MHWFPFALYNPFLSHEHTTFILTTLAKQVENLDDDDLRKSSLHLVLKSSDVISLLKTMRNPTDQLVNSILREVVRKEWRDEYENVLTKPEDERREWVFSNVSKLVFEQIRVQKIREYAKKFFNHDGSASIWYKRPNVHVSMGTFGMINQFSRGHHAWSDLAIVFMFFVGMADTVLVRLRLCSSVHLQWGESVTHVVGCPDPRVCAGLECNRS